MDSDDLTIEVLMDRRADRALELIARCKYIDQAVVMAVAVCHRYQYRTVVRSEGFPDRSFVWGETTKYGVLEESTQRDPR